MAEKNILHMVTPTKHMSPFDVNMALDAGYDAVLTYSNVTIDEVTGLVQDAIFSRPPKARRPHRNVLRRQERKRRPGHAGKSQAGAGAAIRHFVFCRSGWLVHHRRGDGRMRRKAPEGQEKTRLSKA